MNTKEKQPAVYLDHMLEALDKINEFTAGARDEKTYYAIERLLTIIGEAARRLPDTFKVCYPDVPWRKIVAFRNVIIHEYDGIVSKRVWNVVENELPLLRSQLLNIKKEV